MRNGNFKPLEENFEGIPIKLCRVHILRAWRRREIEIFGQTQFLTDKAIKELLTLLRGAFFVPAIFLSQILDFFISEFRPRLPEEKFDDFLAYLMSNYFLSDAKFSPILWSYFSQIADFCDYETSTNSIEGINLQLKRQCLNGNIKFHSACEIIFNFKTS